MDNLDYIFFEEFKHLDKLCGELYKTQYGITHYIDDMKSISVNEHQYIPNWKADLKQLIRVRHIRNYLAHEGTFNEETCTQNDIDWIRTFYQRILNQSDPIAILYQISKAKMQTSKQSHINNQASALIEKQPNKLINEQSNRPKNEHSINLTEEQMNRKMTTADKILVLLTVAAALILIVFYGIVILK